MREFTAEECMVSIQEHSEMCLTHELIALVCIV